MFLSALVLVSTSCAWLRNVKERKTLKQPSALSQTSSGYPTSGPVSVATPVGTKTTVASRSTNPPNSASTTTTTPPAPVTPAAKPNDGELFLPLTPDVPDETPISPSELAQAPTPARRAAVPLPPLPESGPAPLQAQPLLPAVGAEPAFQNLTQANPAPTAPLETPTEAAILQGEANAKVYCATCHEMPGPELLDRDTWLGSVLPAMSPGGSRHVPAADMGTLSLESMNSPLETSRLRAPLIPRETWDSIVNFYAAKAPESLEPASPDRPIDFDIPGFKIEFPQNAPGKPATNAIRIDSTNGRILVGATDPNLFLVFDKDLQLIQEARLSSPPTWFEPMTGPDGKRRLGLTLAGNMDPNDRAEGNLVMIHEQPGVPAYDNAITLLSQLRRPVNTRFGDLNGDGLPDPVIAQFGDTIGQLAWYQSSADAGITERILIPRPGAIKTQLIDWENDGDQDVVVLMTQAREGVYLLRNDGTGNFEEQLLVSTPPVYGSSSFDLADFNGDGLTDILLTCGDNADYSMIFKPYHGLYIWLNVGDDKFEQAHFYPVNGAFNAVARDFDLDGDLDLASVAYFPDFQHRPFEAFLYFENKGDKTRFDFHPFTFDQAVSGRWLPMDVGDVDLDGDVDIVLGNFLRALMGPGQIPPDVLQKWDEPGPFFILLRNQARSPAN